MLVKNNGRVWYADVKMQLQLWKNFLVSPITKSTIVHIYEILYSLLKLDTVSMLLLSGM